MKHKPKPVSIPMSKPASVSMLDKFCMDCSFYDVDEKLCRRHPPTVFLAPSGKAIAHWPPVNPGDGCGEWSANG